MKTDKQRSYEYYQKCCEKYGKEETRNLLGTKEQFYKDIWCKTPKEFLSYDVKEYFTHNEDWQKEC